MSATHQQTTTRTSPNDDESTEQLPARDIQSKDNKSQVLVSTTSHHESHRSDSQNRDTAAPASAAAVNAIMGPPPPKDEKTGSRWERWRRDRKKAKEMGMPSQESNGRWGVKNFAA